jgi:simple sugar transport system ATP-binding protein
VTSVETPGRAPVLALEGITKAYPGVVANDDVSLDLLAGEIHAIVGENGAGKTTLVGTIYGLHRPDAGRILLDGEPVTMPSPRAALARGLGYVQQHFSLIPTLTVAENLVLALRGSPAAVGIGEAGRRVEELGERYGLRVDPDALVEDLSVGLQQRAELLKALARDARVLALDEPNSLLTPQEWEQLEQVLRRLAASGVGILLISHKLDEVLRLADRVSVLRRGRLVATVRASESTEQRLAEMMVGALTAPVVRSGDGARAAADGPALLEVQDLWVRGDRGEDAVAGVSFTARPGEVLGIAGVEGSGQVELTEALCGARPARGSVRLEGRELGGADVRARRRLGIAHVPADRRNGGLVATLSVAENLALPTVGERALSRWGLLNRRAIRSRAEELIEEFDIRVPGPDAPAGTLSGGNQQKVVLARELSRPLRVLLCCYPTWGLDVAAAAAVQRQVLALRDRGAAVLYASVELDELLAVTDRIVVLHRGRVAGELATADATAERLGLMMGGARAA